MDWIKRFVILFVLIAGALLVQTSAGTHRRSKLQLSVPERFEFCVARNLSRTPMFGEEDRERMEKIVMETSERMREMGADPSSENAGNTRTMLRLFAAALACVVADCDSSVRPQRERACMTALEACAESLKKPAGVDVAREMKKIFSAMSREILVLDKIADKSAPDEIRKKERVEKEQELGDKIWEEKKKRFEEAIAKKEEKEQHQEKESEAKERPKRAALNTFQYRGSRMPLQSNPTVESIIADKLLRSTTFNNFFNFGLAQEDAIFYSRSMVASGLSAYRYDIIDEAMNAVTAALSRLGSFAGPNDYAYTIGRSIASVLSAHELTFFADALGIGSASVYQLDSMLGSNPSSTFEISPSFGSASVSSFGSFGAASASSSGWGSSSAVASSQVGGMAPVQVNPSYIDTSFVVPPNPQEDKNQFQNRLSYLLSQSPKISEKFCSAPFPGIYEVMNSAFADYGYPIASTIATVVSNSLNMLPVEAACSQYPDVISEVVGDILSSNGYILTADPQAIMNKISDSINQNIRSNPPPSFGQPALGGGDYELNPSFSDASYSDVEFPAISADQTFSSDTSSFVPDVPPQQQNPVLTNSTEFYVDASPVEIQPSSRQDLPVDIPSDALSIPGESPFSPDDGAATNNSWVFVDSPSQTDQTSGSIDIAPPIVFQPGPVIPENLPSDFQPGPVIPENLPSDGQSGPVIPDNLPSDGQPGLVIPENMPSDGQRGLVIPDNLPSDVQPGPVIPDNLPSDGQPGQVVPVNLPSDAGSMPETKVVPISRTTMAPETVQVTKAVEMTTPVPLSTYFQSSTVVAKSEVSTTPAPQMDLKDAFESPSKLSDFLMKEMTSSLKALNVTTGDTKRHQQDVPKAPADALTPKTPDVSKPAEKPSNPPVQTSTEVQPQQPQNGPPDEEVPLVAPKPITDELSALVFADRVSSIVSSSIILIRSQDFQLDELCRILNELAPMVDLPPLDVCSEVPLIDYLLHVLNAVTYSLGGER